MSCDVDAILLLHYPTKVSRARHLRQACIMMSLLGSRVSGFGAEGQPAKAISDIFQRLKLKCLNVWPVLPPVAWARFGVLFAMLAAAKILLLVQLSKQIYDVHWRVGIPDLGAWDYVNFTLFVMLGMLTLCQFAKRRQHVNCRGSRWINGTILAAGLLFIFLTFHFGDRNYLFPILTGVLKWNSLGP